jgi:hypothetical protein
VEWGVDRRDDRGRENKNLGRPCSRFVAIVVVIVVNAVVTVTTSVTGMRRWWGSKSGGEEWQEGLDCEDRLEEMRIEEVGKARGRNGGDWRGLVVERWD